MKLLKQNKKGVELTLKTVAVLIIMIIVLIVAIVFFTSNYGEAGFNLFKVGNESLKDAKDLI